VRPLDHSLRSVEGSGEILGGSPQSSERIEERTLLVEVLEELSPVRLKQILGCNVQYANRLECASSRLNFIIPRYNFKPSNVLTTYCCI